MIKSAIPSRQTRGGREIPVQWIFINKRQTTAAIQKSRNYYIKRISISFLLAAFFFLIFSSTAAAQVTGAVPELESEAAVVIDAENGSVLFEKKADKVLYPASLTKIATAIYAIETGNLDDVVTVSERARNVEGTRVYLEEGEQVTLKKLIQGLLINSGNDAGVAIAEHLSGSVEQYAADINPYLQNVVGVQHTAFRNPHGLFDPEHVTTAKDLAKITQYAMKNETFRTIFGTKELKWDGEGWDTTLYTHHKLLIEKTYDGVTGGKTGYVDESGVTLATTAERDGQSLVVITMNSETQVIAYRDTVNLIEYSFSGFQTSSISKGTIFQTEEQEYKAPSNLYYTHAAGTQIEQHVSTDGRLDLIDQKGKVINSFVLSAVAKEADRETAAGDASFSEKEFLGNKGIIVIATIAFLVLSVAGFSGRRKSRRKNFYKKAR